MEVLAGCIKKNMKFPKNVASLRKKYELDVILEPKDLTDK